MQGSDPSAYEMIQKIHTLQRRLIKKTEEVIEGREAITLLISGLTELCVVYCNPLSCTTTGVLGSRSSSMLDPLHCQVLTPRKTAAV